MTQVDAPWPSGDGEMAALIRAFDWAATPLGPITGWPQSLKTIVNLMLGSSSMMSLVWGTEAIHLYNDSFTDLLREHRVQALGHSAFETFARSRDVFAADVAAGMAGRSARLIGQRYPVLRNGRLEEAWFDAEYAPVHDDLGRIAGVLWTLKETTAQHLAEHALRASEERHRLLIESWAQAVWETDADGVVTVDSPSWRAYTGQTLEAWLGYGWLDAIHPDDRAYAERHWREAITAGGLVNAEFRLRAPDGGWRWTNVRAAPARDARGAIERWVGLNIDIDARKSAEAALRNSEKRYRTLFEAMDEAYAVVEVLKDQASAWSDFRFVEVNPAFVKHTAMPYPVGKTATDLLGTPSPRWTQMYGQALDTGMPLRVQESEQTLGRTFDLNIFSLDPGRNRVAVLFTDITERAGAEAALRASEERFRAFVTASADVVYRMSPDWRELRVLDGRGFLADTVSPSDDWLSAYIDPADQPRLREAIQQAVEAKAMFELEHPVRQADGRLGWALSRAVPLLDEAGEIREWIGAASDVTARKQAEDELRASEERFRGLVEGFGQFSWEASADGLIEADSPGWRAFTGQRVDEWLGWGWINAIHPDDRDGTGSKWREAVAMRTAVDHEYRLWHAPSASWRWSNVRAVPITNPDGSIRKWSGVNIDVTDHHKLLVRQDVLINELQHRSRNLLGVVTAVAGRTLQQGGSVESFEERLKALSRVQALLSQSGSDAVEVGALVRAELAVHANEASDRFTVAGPEVHLKARQVQNFALAVHELTTNAVKYGALKVETGRLDVTWAVVLDRRAHRRLALSWVESGVAIDPEQTKHRGYGMELIQEALAYAMEAEVDYALGPDGVRCRIEMPLT